MAATATAAITYDHIQPQILQYVPNPHRRSLITEHVAVHDGLLNQVASF